MRAVTPQTETPLAAFDGLLDLERSRGFHAGKVDLDLSRMTALLAALGPLPDPAVAVHVAGSEGKTSTTELVAAGLRAHGLRAATYTSPHLRDPRERLRIDGRFPPDALLAAAVERVRAAAQGIEPTWFEAMTATARVLFALAEVDAVVWETGLGGRLDATRLLPAHACAITTVSLEHTAVLGGDVPTIAREKAGIVRPGVPVALGPGLVDEAAAVVEEVAAALDATVLRVPAAVPADPDGVADPAAASRSLAAAVLDLLADQGRVPPRHARIDAALATHVVAGRNELVDGVLYEGAHTVAAVERLVRRLGGRRVGAVVFGATSGRNAEAMLTALLPLADSVVVTRPAGPRGVDPAPLAEAVAALHPSVTAIEDAPRALSHARDAVAGRVSETGAADRPAVDVLVTGSLHLLGELLPPGSLPT